MKRTCLYALVTACSLALMNTLPALGFQQVDSNLHDIPHKILGQNNSSHYGKAESDLGKDWYPIYRVTEKILRANNLDDKPWRIRLIPKYDINAYATEANLIAIYSGLLDQVYGDAAALACVIGHEIGHHRKSHIPLRVASAEEEKQTLIDDIKQGRKKTNRSNRTLGVLGGVFGFPTGIIAESNVRRRLKKEEQQLEEFEQRRLELSRKHEYEADLEGLELATMAGYDPEGCLRILTVLSRLPTGYLDSTHPSAVKRVDAMKQAIADQSLEDVKAKGRENLYRSNAALTYDRSSDGLSIRINSKNGDNWKF